MSIEATELLLTHPPADIPVADEASPPRWRTIVHYSVLSLVFCFGTALRFSNLSHPGIWKDEAATYWRVTGTYGQMLDILQYDGFMPLHYEMYFVLGRVTDLSPSMMRLIPATAGSLTILAVYFLARQMFTRRVALLAAIMTAFSAFFFYYSRDAKMYAALYLTCITSVACLLWWLRTRRTEAWLAWVAVSVAMLGLHALGLVVLGLQPLILLTHRRGPHWRPTVAFIVGAALIVSGLVVHVRYFNQLKEKIDQEGWQASGLAWIDREIAGDRGEDLLEFALVQDIFTGIRKEMRVSDPTITVYRPASPNGTAVIVAPGGGYGGLAIEHEGTMVCDWLVKQGVPPRSLVTWSSANADARHAWSIPSADSSAFRLRAAL